MHETVIRSGTIVDGGGGAPYTGDLAIDGERIRKSGELGLALERRRAGEIVTVSLVRDGKVRDVKVTLDGPG